MTGGSIFRLHLQFTLLDCVPCVRRAKREATFSELTRVHLYKQRTHSKSLAKQRQDTERTEREDRGKESHKSKFVLLNDES